MISREEAFMRIRDTPKCVAELDNDSWSVRKRFPDGFAAWTDTEQEEWWETATIVCSREVDGCDYAGGLVEVLAVAVDMTVQGV